MNTEVNTQAATLIHVQLESGPLPLPAGATLAELVASLGHAPDAIATAVDGQHVARSLRHQHALRDGACVLLFRPIVGG